MKLWIELERHKKRKNRENVRKKKRQRNVKEKGKRKKKEQRKKTQKEGLVNLGIREPTNHLLLVHLKVVIVPYVMPHMIKMMKCGYNVRIVKCGVTKTVLVMEIGRKKT